MQAWQDAARRCCPSHRGADAVALEATHEFDQRVLDGSLHTECVSVRPSNTSRQGPSRQGQGGSAALFKLPYSDPLAQQQPSMGGG